MKKILFYLTVILFFVSCNIDKKSKSDEMAPLYPAPETIFLNTDEGYKINPVTGYIIQSIVNSLSGRVRKYNGRILYIFHKIFKGEIYYGFT